MGTTTILLEEDPQARVAAAAEREGKTTHAFIVDAIARAVERSKSDEEFQRNADERWAELRETGKLVAFDEARVYLEARAQGRRPAPPRHARWPADTRRRAFSDRMRGGRSPRSQRISSAAPTTQIDPSTTYEATKSLPQS